MWFVKFVCWNSLMILLLLSGIISRGDDVVAVKGAMDIEEIDGSDANSDLGNTDRIRIVSKDGKLYPSGTDLDKYLQNIKQPRLALVVSVKSKDKNENDFEGSKNKEEFRQNLMRTLLENGEVKSVNSLGQTSEEIAEKRHLDSKHEELWALVQAMMHRKNELQEEQDDPDEKDVQDYHEEGSNEDKLNVENLINDYNDNKDYDEEDNSLSKDEQDKQSISNTSANKFNTHKDELTEPSIELIEKIGPSSLGRFFNRNKKHDLFSSSENSGDNIESEEEDDSEECTECEPNYYHDKNLKSKKTKKFLDPYHAHIKFSKYMFNKMRDLNDLESKKKHRIRRDTKTNSTNVDVTNKFDEKSNLNNKEEITFGINSTKTGNFRNKNKNNINKSINKQKNFKKPQEIRKERKYVKSAYNNQFIRNNPKQHYKGSVRNKALRSEGKHYYIDLNSLENNKKFAGITINFFNKNKKNKKSKRSSSYVQKDFNYEIERKIQQHKLDRPKQKLENENKNEEYFSALSFPFSKQEYLYKEPSIQSLKHQETTLSITNNNNNKIQRKKRSLRSKSYVPFKGSKHYKDSIEFEDDEHDYSSSVDIDSPSPTNFVISDLLKKYINHRSNEEESEEDWSPGLVPTSIKEKIIKNYKEGEETEKENNISKSTGESQLHLNSSKIAYNKSLNFSYNKIQEDQKKEPSIETPIAIAPTSDEGMNMTKIAQDFNKAVERVITVVPLEEPIIESRKDDINTIGKNAKAGQSIYLKKKGGFRIPLRLVQDNDGNLALQLDMNYICKKCSRQRLKRRRQQQQQQRQQPQQSQQQQQPQEQQQQQKELEFTSR